MLLWFPEHVPRETVLAYVQGFPRDSFRQILQDRVYSRYPTFNHVKVYIDSNFEEIDTTCAICYEAGEYQLDCGHIFHKRCIMQWKKKTCPLCRAPIVI